MKKFRLMFFQVMIASCYTMLQAEESALDLIVPPEQIEARICEVAAELNSEYADKRLTIVMIMKGAVCVTADLIRNLTIPFNLEYVKASSYGYNGMTGGKLIVGGLETLDIEERDVLLVDDIFETGNTMMSIVDQLQVRQPKSIKTFVLLVKDVPRTTTYRPDYVLFDIPDRFVIGYGLDYKELYRGLPGIYAFPGDIPPF